VLLMMDVWCDECHARVLVWPGDLKGVVNTDHGLIVAYRCGAGHDGAEMIGRAEQALRG
jgi:hypothetical protein